MSGTPNNQNNTSQPTKIQVVKTTIIGGGILAVVTGGLTILNYTGTLAQLCEYLAFPCPGKNIGKQKEYPPPEWIGTKIEDIRSGQLASRENSINIVETDKPAGDNLSLKNVDQDLSALGRGYKNNSQDYRVHLRREKELNKAVCLEIYGERIPAKSEFKNIIQINSFPSDKDYNSLTPEQRDEQCKKHKDLPRTTIVYPKS